MSRDGSAIIARGSNDSTVFIWRVADGAQLLVYRDFTQTVYSVDLTPDRTLYAIPGSEEVLLRSTKDGTLVRSIAQPSGYLTFNNTGDILAVDGENNTALLYRVSDGTLLKTLTGHSSGILSLAFNPSGTILATGSLDKTLKLWDMNGNLLKSITAANNYVNGVSFDPTGSYVAGRAQHFGNGLGRIGRKRCTGSDGIYHRCCNDEVQYPRQAFSDRRIHRKDQSLSCIPAMDQLVVP